MLNQIKNNKEYYKYIFFNRDLISLVVSKHMPM